MTDTTAKTMPLFHGTSRQLDVGTVLLPGAAVGRDNYPDLDGAHSHRVFVTTSIEAAAYYAIEAVNSDHHAEADLFVYEVRVDGPLGIDGRISGEDFTCEQAVIVREVQPEELHAARR